MVQVSLDTSFLISFADPDRPNHPVAVEYYRHCLACEIPMWISTIAAGEFEVGQPVSDLPLQNFRIQPFNLLHAIRAAALSNSLRKLNYSSPTDRRPVNYQRLETHRSSGGGPNSGDTDRRREHAFADRCPAA